MNEKGKNFSSYPIIPGTIYDTLINNLSNIPLSYYLFVSDVCTKYQEASKIVNLALQGLVGMCVPGAKTVDLCQVS